MFVTGFWKLLNQGLKLHLLIRISHLASGTWLSFSLLTLLLRESDSDQQFLLTYLLRGTLLFVQVVSLNWNEIEFLGDQLLSKQTRVAALLPLFPSRMEEMFVSQNLLFGDWKLVLSSRCKKVNFRPCPLNYCHMADLITSKAHLFTE